MSIYQHYHDEEKPFVKRMLEWIQSVNKMHTLKRTDFLNPRQREILTELVNYNGEIAVFFAGGLQEAERKRAIIAPSYYELECEEFHLAYYSIDYAHKFNVIEHRHVLGALTNLGLDREKLGDIIIANKDVQIVVAREIAPFIELNLRSVGKATVRLKQIVAANLLEDQERWKMKTGIVPSLRLDALVAEMFNLSRAKAAAYIQKGQVRTNWRLIEEPNFECSPSDIISVRGHGRGKLVAIDGKTRKNNWRIQFGKL